MHKYMHILVSDNRFCLVTLEGDTVLNATNVPQMCNKNTTEVAFATVLMGREYPLSDAYEKAHSPSRPTSTSEMCV